MKRLLVILFLAPVVFGQDPLEARISAMKEKAVAEATDPEPHAVGVILPKALTIDLSEKDKKSSISGNYKQGNVTFSAKLTAPIDDADQPVIFGDLTGLAAKTVGEGKVTYMSWNPRIDRLRLEAACRKLKNARRKFTHESLRMKRSSRRTSPWAVATMSSRAKKASMLASSFRRATSSRAPSIAECLGSSRAPRKAVGRTTSGSIGRRYPIRSRRKRVARLCFR
jgi:hypothetical protein